MRWRQYNMYITIELTDNIDLRKLIFRDVKVNPRTLAVSFRNTKEC